jgi:hypothetical protein
MHPYTQVRVGWVERSETHHLSNAQLVMVGAIAMGFASLYPSYKDQGFLISPAGVMKIIKFATMMVPARK